MVHKISLTLFCLSLCMMQSMHAMEEESVGGRRQPMERSQSMITLRLKPNPSISNLRKHQDEEQRKIEDKRIKQEKTEQELRNQQACNTRMLHEVAGLGTGKGPLRNTSEAPVQAHFEKAQRLLACGADITWGYPLLNLLLAFKLREECNFHNIHSWQRVKNPSIFGAGHKFLAWLVDNGADVNKTWSQDDVNRFTHYDYKYETECESKVAHKATNVVPLKYAVELCTKGCCVEKLLKAGAHTYQGALYDALHSANPSAAVVLLEHNASVEGQDRHGNTPGHWAMNARFYNPADRVRVLEALHKHNCSFAVQNTALRTPLHDAIVGDSIRILGDEVRGDFLKQDTSSLQFLLAHEPVLDVQDAQGATVLYHAVDRMSVYFVDQKRIAYGLYNKQLSEEKVLGQLWEKFKPYDLFAQNNKVVEMLVHAGADCSIAQKDGLTPLHRAAQRGMAECVQLLVTHKAPVDAQDAQGLTPLHYAVLAQIPFAETAVIVTELIKNGGANPEVQDREGNAVLLKAALADDLQAFDLLLALGAKPDARNARNLTVAEMLEEKVNCRSESKKTMIKRLDEYVKGIRKPLFTPVAQEQVETLN